MERDPLRIWQRVFGASGILFMILLNVRAYFRSGRPEPDAPPADLAAWLADHRTGQFLGGAIGGLGMVVLIVFAASLYHILWRAEGGDTTLAARALGGGAASATLGFVAYAGNMAAASIAGRVADPGVPRALEEVSEYLERFPYCTLAILLGAASAVVLRTRVLPRWIGWLGLVAVLPMLARPWPIEALALRIAIGFLGFPLFSIWILAASVVLLRRSRAPRPAAAIAAA